jgi:hypothetical protein
MNTIISLTIEQQETNRIAKGYDIFTQNLVEQISNNEYIIAGKYYVEYFPISDIYTCNCPDHSFRQIRCKHIIAVSFYQMEV